LDLLGFNYIHQNFPLQLNKDTVGKFSFSNRLSDIISLLGDKRLKENKPKLKKPLKPKFWKHFQLNAMILNL
jgi:hypothetical protein